jgi:hypothetical protein
MKPILSRRSLAPGALTVCSLAFCLAGHPSTATETPLEMAFQSPPSEFRARPLYWLNAPLSRDELRAQLTAMREYCGFGGLAPLVLKSARPEYLTEEYFEYYGFILDTAKALGLKVIFYDDISFPTGTAGGRVAEKFPDSVIKNLRKEERAVSGGESVELPVPHGTLMAVVAMETESKRLVDLEREVQDGTLRWTAPPGTWQVMFFLCTPGGQFVDYLDADAVRKWMSLTYDEFARRFPEHFGTTIVQAFFDDPAMVYTSGGRTWTTSFNEKFRGKHGRSPAILYPALWYDIGPETESARVAMFGMRAEMFSESFVGTLQEWCARHKIQISGHPAGNYEPQPVEVSGDNIKFYEHCDIPLLDSIHYYGHGRDGFKLVTSASTSYDRPVTAVEIYGNYPDNSVDRAMLYRSAMELYVRGANLMIPHGMWYEPATMYIPPEFSHRNPRFGDELPAYNDFVGRCSLLLQGGRHVAEIGILYPVVALQAAYRFDVPGRQQPNWGKDAPPEADYLTLSKRLTGSIRRDFTFLHPEIIDHRCQVQGPVLRLDNQVNHQEYRVIIIPGGKVISWSNLRKIREFYQHGGHVVATTQLPFKSSEPGHDQDVRRTIREMFGIEPVDLVEDPSDKPYRVRLEIRGHTIKTHVRDVLVDVTVDDGRTQGGIGFRQGGGGEVASVRWIRVTSPEGRRLFEDQFDAGLGQWQHTRNARLEDGSLIVQDTEFFRSKAGADWTDYDIELELNPDAEPAGLVFRNSEDGANCYMWQLWPGKNQLRPHKKVEGRWWTLKDVPCVDVDESLKSYEIRIHASGGRAYFAPNPTVGTLQAILDEALPVANVAFETAPEVSSGGGMLSYLHKVKDGRQLYYFANSSDDRVDTWVRLRGKHTLQLWDPHTGSMTPIECSHQRLKGQDVTRVRLLLEPVRSVFLIGPSTGQAARSVPFDGMSIAR